LAFCPAIFKADFEISEAKNLQSLFLNNLARVIIIQPEPVPISINVVGC